MLFLVAETDGVPLVALWNFKVEYRALISLEDCDSSINIKIIPEGSYA